MCKANVRFIPSLIAAALSSVVLLACGGEESVTSGAIGYDNTVQALTGNFGMPLQPMELQGTYGPNCKRNAGATWTLLLNDPSDNSLEVVKNDTFANCPLNLTTIRVQEGGSGALVNYTVDPPINLNLGYSSNPSTVKAPGGAPAFYTNAKLNDLTGPVYSNDFRIAMVYSDNKLACGSYIPFFVSVTATAFGHSIPPPNYDVNFGDLLLLVDANNVVQNESSGNVKLMPPSSNPQAGEEYKIFVGTGCCGGASASFAEIDYLYIHGTPVPNGTGTISGPGPVTIPWTSFDLVGKQLRQDRSIIVKHMGEGGVYSYELVELTFLPLFL